MSGDIDYMRIVVTDVADYPAVYRKLIRSVELWAIGSALRWSSSSIRRRSPGLYMMGRARPIAEIAPSS